MAVFPAGLKMAPPASPGVIIAVAVSLLLVAAGLSLLAPHARAKLVSAVALANVTAAFIIAFWLIAGWNAFSVTGRGVATATVAGLIPVALAELLATMAPAARE